MNTKNRHVYTAFSPLCSFMYNTSHTELSIKVISYTTIIKTEFDLKVRNRWRLWQSITVHVQSLSACQARKDYSTGRKMRTVQTVTDK